MNRNHLEATGILLVIAGLALLSWAAYLLAPQAGYAVAGAGLAGCGIVAVRAANAPAPMATPEDPGEPL